MGGNIAARSRNKSGPRSRPIKVSAGSGVVVADTTAFEGLVGPHLDYLYAFAYKLCGERQAAEDVVQDSLLRAYRAIDQLRNREQPRFWLTKIVASVCADRFRRERGRAREVSIDDERHFSLFDTLIEEDPFPYSDRLHLDFLDLFDDERLVAALGRLYPAHRTALVLAYVYGYKAREIAELTNSSLGTVLSRLQRGRSQLERALWELARDRGLVEGVRP
jgi:RNA polymerase sigma-70 factor, ECF subfamily